MSKRVVAAVCRPLVGLAVTTVTVTLVTTPGPPARADTERCPSDSLCLYPEYDQQGTPQLTTSRNLPELYPPPAPLSVSNTTDGWVLLYADRHYTGRCVAVRADANLDGGFVRSVQIDQPDSAACEPSG